MKTKHWYRVSRSTTISFRILRSRCHILHTLSAAPPCYMATVLHIPRRAQEAAIKHHEGDTLPSDKPMAPATSLACAARSTRRKTEEKTEPQVLVSVMAMNSGKVSLPFLLRLLALSRNDNPVNLISSCHRCQSHCHGCHRDKTTAGTEDGVPYTLHIPYTR